MTARELTEAALARIAERDGELGAFVAVDAELALRAADAVDATIAAGGDPGPLAGVPIGVKELDHCAGFVTTMGSCLRVGDRPATDDSIHVARLRGAGAVPVGMTASPEFGTVAYTRSNAWGVTRNPWDPSRTPGGSSGGSAAAVAAGMVPLATGGDGGGSIRIPASFSGLVGHKTSYGRIPVQGASTSQTAVPGVLATTVADAARHLDVACGPDDRDRASLPHPGVTYERAIEELSVAGLRVAWSADLGFARVDPEVRALTETAASALIADAGLNVVDLDIELGDPTEAWLRAGAIDMWLHLEPGDWPERAELLVPSVRRSYEQTEAWTLPRYADVLRARTRLEAGVAAIFERVDVLLTPATAVPAFAAEGPPPSVIDGHPVHPAMAVPFTMIANLCWNPAVSVPAGTVSDGLPIGLQIMGPRHRDDIVLRLARIVEQRRPWPRLAPTPSARHDA